MPHPAPTTFLPPVSRAKRAHGALKPSNGLQMNTQNLGAESKQLQYYRDKQEGIRRANGALNLKRLTGRHVAILKLHLLGHTNTAIADHMRISAARVSSIIHDPLAITFLEKCYNDTDKEFEALYGSSVDVLRSAMDSVRVADQLRAVDIYYKKRGDYSDNTGGGDTAEDVVKRVINMQLNVNIDGQSMLPQTSMRVLENEDE